MRRLEAFDDEAQERISALVKSGSDMRSSMLRSSSGKSSQPETAKQSSRAPTTRVRNVASRPRSTPTSVADRSSLDASEGNGTQSTAMKIDQTAVPESVAVAMYRQERDDRLYVERLFVLREEHHARQLLCADEGHEWSVLRAAHGFDARLLRLNEQHLAEQEALQYRLEDASHVSRLRRQLRETQERLDGERDSVARLQREVASRERDRQSVVEQERTAWSEEKLLLLQRVEALQSTIAQLRANGTAPPLSSDHIDIAEPRRSETHGDVPVVPHLSDSPVRRAAVQTLAREPETSRSPEAPNRERNEPPLRPDRIEARSSSEPHAVAGPTSVSLRSVDSAMERTKLLLSRVSTLLSD